MFIYGLRNSWWRFFSTASWRYWLNSHCMHEIQQLQAALCVNFDMNLRLNHTVNEKLIFYPTSLFVLYSNEAILYVAFWCAAFSCAAFSCAAFLCVQRSRVYCVLVCTALTRVQRFRVCSVFPALCERSHAIKCAWDEMLCVQRGQCSAAYKCCVFRGVSVQLLTKVVCSEGAVFSCLQMLCVQRGQCSAAYNCIIKSKYSMFKVY